LTVLERILRLEVTVASHLHFDVSGYTLEELEEYHRTIVALNKPTGKTK
jgi:hypothetical protein